MCGHRNSVQTSFWLGIIDELRTPKPLPDQRTIDQPRESEAPTELVDFVRQMHEGKLDMEMLLLQRSARISSKCTLSASIILLFGSLDFCCPDFWIGFVKCYNVDEVMVSRCS